MRRYLLVATAALLSCGCPKPVPEKTAKVIVNNSTAWTAALLYAADAQQTEVRVAPGGSQSVRLEACPQTFALLTQTLDPDGARVATDLAVQAHSTLTNPENFNCGDLLIVEIAPTTTTVQTEPAE
jgi:hypothetical protein